MNVRRLGLIGFGNVAESGHLAAWRQRRDFEIVAVADPDPARRARAAELLPGAAIHAEADELLAEEHLDVVDIATPPFLHAGLATEAARRGVHVVCEKPLATSMEDYGPLLAAARDSGVTIYTVHNWKCSRQFVRVTALLAEGAIGKLTHALLETVRTGRAVTVGSDWRGEARLAGGGILADHGWHAFYLLLALGGTRPRRVSARLERRNVTGADVEDTASCRLDFGSMVGEMHLTWAGAERRTRWMLRGTEGSLVVEQSSLEVKRRKASYRYRFDGSLSDGSHHPDWFDAVIDGFAREVSDPARRGENLSEAGLCLLLTSLAYESAGRGGKAIEVPAPHPVG